MSSFIQHTLGKKIVVTLDRGDDILKTIGEIAEKEQIKKAVIVAGLGGFDYLAFRFVKEDRDVHKKWEGKILQVSTVQGYVIDGKPEICCAAGDKYNSWCGHIEEGCLMLFYCQIMLIELLDT